MDGQHIAVKPGLFGGGRLYIDGREVDQCSTYGISFMKGRLLSGKVVRAILYMDDLGYSKCRLFVAANEFELQSV